MDQKIGNEISPILNTILERCKKEKDRGFLLASLDDHYERVSYYTALPKLLIQQLTGEVDTKTKLFNTSDHILLLECIASLLQKKVLPILKNVFEEFKDINVAKGTTVAVTFSSFFSEINLVGYEYKKILDGPVIIMENPKITFDRFHYLSKMMKFRNQEGKHIYYIDERCIDLELSYSKPIDRKYNEDEYIFLFMMSSNGYEHGLFTTEISEEVYKKWVLDILLPMIKPSSIIVLTNSYLQGNEMFPITRYHSKMKMIQWLNQNNIPCSSDMNKAELFDLIEKCTIKSKGNDVDRILQSYGHDVLHLPSTFENISPVEFMWENVKKYVNIVITNTDNIFEIKNKIYNYLTNLDTATWEGFIKESQKLENQIFDVDKKIGDLFDAVCTLDDTYDLDAPCVCNFYHVLAMGNK